MSSPSPVASPHRIVVVGGGFGGLFAARRLSRSPVEVTLVDRSANHVFQPMLYQSATGVVPVATIAPPLRAIFRRRRNVRVLLAEVVGFDLDGRLVHARSPDGELTLPYDSLIVAAGAKTSYFGHDEYAKHAPGLKSVDDAMTIGRRIFGAFEVAEATEDPKARQAWLTFAVVGAGPSGVELSGQIRQAATHTLKSEYRSIDPASARVLLFDGGKEPLATFGDHLSERATRTLQKLGVELHMGSLATAIDDHSLEVRSSDGQVTRYEARTIVWTAGVAASPLGRMLAEAAGASTDRAGRVEVRPDCTLPGRPEVFVIGDLMSLNKLPGVAEVAMQSGLHAARTIRHRLEGRETGPFHYVDMGSMAFVGGRHAIVDFRGLKLSGFLGWLMWATVHLTFLTGFMNRVAALFNWLPALTGTRRVRVFSASDVPAPAAGAQVRMSQPAGQPGERDRPDQAHAAAGATSFPDPLGAPDPLEAPLSTAEDRVVVAEWSRRIPPIMARIPEVRIGKRWYSTAWLIPISIAGLIILIAVCQQLRTYPAVQTWIAGHPGTGDFQPPVTTGFPLWLRILHFLNLLFMLFIIRAGIQILADHPRLQTDAGCMPGRERLRLRGPVPPDRMAEEPPERAWTAKDDAVTLPRWLGIPGIRHSIGLARWWHFSFDFLWVLTGVAFYVLLFTTGQWARLVPVNWSVIPNAISTAIQYGSLQFPANKGWTQYNGLQIMAYFVVVFIAAPLAVITGLLQAPAIAARFGLGWGRINRQTARIVHFGVLVIFVGFIFIHTVMVWITGLLLNLNHITTGHNIASWTGWWLYVIWMAIVVAVWLAASPLTLRYPRVVQKTGRALIGWAKALLENTDPRATYPEKAISPFFWPNGALPTSQEYANLRDHGFRDYSLRVDGLVDKPVTLSYEQLKAMPKQEQITQHYCIQGWSGVAKWGGVPMRDILSLVQPSPQARFAVFYSFGSGTEGGLYYDAHKIEHMRHHLTILAYEMNGAPLNELHGAPLRLRNELELGFKHVKWIQAIEFVESFAHLGAGQGGYNEDHQFYGYRMPI